MKGQNSLWPTSSPHITTKTHRRSGLLSSWKQKYFAWKSTVGHRRHHTHAKKSNLIRELHLQIEHKLKKHARQKHQGRSEETFRADQINSESNNHQQNRSSGRNTEAAFSQQEAHSQKSSVWKKKFVFVFFSAEENCWMFIAWWIQSLLKSV